MYIHNTYILLLFLIISWSINPFFKKYGPKSLNSEEYLLFNHAIVTLIILILLIYLFGSRICNIKSFKKITAKELFISLVGSTITVCSSFCLIKLLKSNDTSYIIPQIQPCVIILTIIIGYFLFNEKINTYKILGIFLIILGLFLINKIY